MGDAFSVFGWERAAELHGGDPFAQRMELVDGVVDVAVAEEARVSSADDTGPEVFEGGPAGVGDSSIGAGAGHQAVERQPVEGWVSESPGAEAVHSGGDEIADWVCGDGEPLYELTEGVEAVLGERAEEALLGPEQRVDRACRRPRTIGDRAHRNGVGPVVGEELFGDGEERGAGLFIVLCGTAHLDKITQLRYVTV